MPCLFTPYQIGWLPNLLFICSTNTKTTRTQLYTKHWARLSPTVPGFSPDSGFQFHCSMTLTLCFSVCGSWIENGHHRLIYFNARSQLVGLFWEGSVGVALSEKVWSLTLACSLSLCFSLPLSPPPPTPPADKELRFSPATCLPALLSCSPHWWSGTLTLCNCQPQLTLSFLKWSW